MDNNKLTFDQIVAGEGSYIPMPSEYGKFKHLAYGIVCADGESLSVQASRTHYCSPRTDSGPYGSVEVGFPSVSPPDTWAEYFDGDWETDDHTGSVYAWVPVALVREFIEAHGGEVGAPRICGFCGGTFAAGEVRCRGCGGDVGGKTNG